MDSIRSKSRYFSSSDTVDNLHYAAIEGLNRSGGQVMATATQNITCGNCVFYNQFDSANLAKVEQVKVNETPDNENREGEVKYLSNSLEEKPDCEFNVWTKHDCHGTEYQNNNRTWFYFGIKPNNPGVCIKFNVVNLNRQSKMFSQGMCPVFKTVPSHPHWERIREKPTYSMDQKGSEFTLSFVYRTPENPKAISYLAFTYPFTYQDLQNYLNKIDNRMAKRILLHPDDIYYHRECAIKSLEGRRLDVLTISSFHNILTEREDRLDGMFPDVQDERAFKFRGKKVVFMSARVHPGETPSSFVFNGFLNFLLNRDDPTAVILRRIYVFKLIPMLNPDGVARGHYRMDTKGVNLNRVYLEPSIKDHPTIFAARSLIRYYHNHYEIVDEVVPRDTLDVSDKLNLEVGADSHLAHPSPVTSVVKDTTNKLLQQVTLMTLDETNKRHQESLRLFANSEEKSTNEMFDVGEKFTESKEDTCNGKPRENSAISTFSRNSEDSGLFLYIDMHGHASKKGVFMYGNYFDDPEDTIMCMLLPKLMSMNNPNFHFTSCSFAERNMYLIDKRDGMSREGSGRVAVYKLTGLVRSYTLECNYNSGRLVNTLPARLRDGNNKTPSHMFVPPKYTPTVFEEVGAALGPSILDLTNSNPNSRLPNSQYRSLRGVKSFLKLTCVNNHSASINRQRNKDKIETMVKESLPLDEIETSMNYVVTKVSEGDNGASSETNIGTKSRIVRRTTSLYAAIKRMKSTKKSRQVANRKCLKSQRKMNMENGPVVKTLRPSNHAINTSLLKPVSSGYRMGVRTNLQNISTPLASSSSCKKQEKKTTKFSAIDGNSSNEPTTAVKQGSKRLKIVSPRIMKTRPEIGESSKSSIQTQITATATSDEKETSANVKFRNKPPIKGFVRSRKPGLKNEAKTKTRKSAKVKTKI